MARKALGRGLSGMISGSTKTATTNAAAQTDGAADAPAPSGTGLQELPPERIDASRWQPRTFFDDEHLQQLAESIREQGLVEPIVVRRKEGGRYEVIAGERRLRAVLSLEWATIPAVVKEDVADSAMCELALVENLQREDLNAIEIAVAYQILNDENGMTHEQIAKRLGVSRASVTNTLRLLELPEEIRQYVAGNELSAGHARALLTVRDPIKQLRLAKTAIEKGWTVREIEKQSRPSTPAKERSSTKDSNAAPTDRFVADLEQRLQEHLGTKVRIHDTDGTGRIEIEYYSHDDVARILERLGLHGDG